MQTENLIYHVIVRGNNRRGVFNNDFERREYLELMRTCAREEQCVIHSYCLMTNHVHSTVSANPVTLAKMMKRLNQTFSQRSNGRHGTVDHVWRNRFRRFVINDDSYMLACGIYIALNPVRADMVRRPEDYPWSSYGELLSGKNDGVTEPDPAFLSLGQTHFERVEAYRNIAAIWQQNPVTKKEAKKFFSSQPEIVHPKFAR